MNIPEKMLALRLYEAGGKLKFEETEVPVPGAGEVLVKMDASPVNPSDLALLTGGYLERSYPFTPGLEGSGTVVAAGSGVFPRLRLGKRVACSPQAGADGTWAAYMKTDAMKTAPLPAGISQEQGSMMLVNPMTVMAFIQLAREGKHRAMVNNAAASSLGKMLIKVTGRAGIPLINIVRKAEQVEQLRALGATHVLDSSSPGFAKELKQVASELGATLFLDAVTGEGSATLLDVAPPGSTLLVYARLSGQPMTADPGTLLKEDKKIVGFQLGNWLQNKSILFKLRFISSVKRSLGGDLASHINRRYPLEEAEEAIAHYREHMSEGKIILNISKPKQ